ARQNDDVEREIVAVKELGKGENRKASVGFHFDLLQTSNCQSKSQVGCHCDEAISFQRALGIASPRKRRAVRNDIENGLLRNLSLFLPRLAETDVNDEKDADVQRKRHLRRQIGAVVRA